MKCQAKNSKGYNGAAYGESSMPAPGESRIGYLQPLHFHNIVCSAHLSKIWTSVAEIKAEHIPQIITVHSTHMCDMVYL